MVVLLVTTSHEPLVNCHSFGYSPIVRSYVGQSNPDGFEKENGVVRSWTCCHAWRRKRRRLMLSVVAEKKLELLSSGWIFGVSFQVYG